MLSFIIPTRNRPDTLERTLRALGDLDEASLRSMGGAEVVIADNASIPPVAAPCALANGATVNVLHLPRNKGAAARNDAAHAAQGEWLVMLDDDSHPLGADFIEALRDAPQDVAAVAAEIFLPSGEREAGGLPEVIVGCGAAVRRNAFLSVGGYDESFHYYAEEYDLCAKLLLGGRRVVFDRRFAVLHEKTSAGRDMSAILRRLTRNNVWIAARYAPKRERRQAICSAIGRYAAIASKERAELGWLRGMLDIAITLRRQPDRAMPRILWDRFTGLSCARRAFAFHGHTLRNGPVAIIARGKHAALIAQALRECGASMTQHQASAAAFVVGSMSPGPMLDALERFTTQEARGAGRPVIAPWLAAQFAAPAQVGVAALAPSLAQTAPDMLRTICA